MHVTIVQLTGRKDDWIEHHVDEDEVFAGNPEKFYSGVEEHHGDAFVEDVDELCAQLGAAVTCRGAEEVSGRRVLWVEVDPDRTDSLFSRPRAWFSDALAELNRTDGLDFMNGGYKIESALQKLRESYDFDWMYVIDENGYTRTIAEWLRNLRRDAKEKPGVRRFYAHASYDGAQ